VYNHNNKTFKEVHYKLGTDNSPYSSVATVKKKSDAESPDQRFKSINPKELKEQLMASHF
jgi:hypothetical protein